jgi:hypothetical protein
VDKLTIHSESLLQVHLVYLNGWRQLTTVVAPGLKELKLYRSFVRNQPVADISAPQLVLLEWKDSYDPSSVQLGNFFRLKATGPALLKKPRNILGAPVLQEEFTSSRLQAKGKQEKHRLAT